MSKIYFAIAFLVAALLVGVVLVWPKYQSLDVLNEDIKVKEMELQSKTDYFNHIRDISRKLEDHQEALAKINSALPDDPLLPSTFNYIQNAASQTGLILEEVAVGSAGAFGGEDIKTINLNLSLAGSYDSLKSFLLEIENSARIIKVKKIKFEVLEEDEPFSFEIDLVTYNH